MKQTTNVTVSLRAGSQTGHMKVESPMPNPEVQGPNVETHSPISTQVCNSHIRQFGNKLCRMDFRVCKQRLMHLQSQYSKPCYKCWILHNTVMNFFVFIIVSELCFELENLM